MTFIRTQFTLIERTVSNGKRFQNTILSKALKYIWKSSWLSLEFVLEYSKYIQFCTLFVLSNQHFVNKEDKHLTVYNNQWNISHQCRSIDTLVTYESQTWRHKPLLKQQVVRCGVLSKASPGGDVRPKHGQGPPWRHRTVISIYRYFSVVAVIPQRVPILGEITATVWYQNSIN